MLHRSEPLGEAHAAVSDRWGGVSTGRHAELNLADHVGDDPQHVAENRGRLASVLGLAPGSVAFMTQIHGCEVAVVDGPPTPGRPPPQADALVTRAQGVALAVLVADCVPVLLAGPSPAGPVVAAAHAGRRGVALGVVAATVETMAVLGARPDRVSALVGPAVCAQCYEVPGAMAQEFLASVPSARATSRTGTPALDLPAAVTAQLHTAGVGDVAVDPTCTAQDPSLYSHRRDAVTGRFAGVVWTAG